MSGRRGFTIMETVLAAAMGALLVVVVAGILAMIDRTETLTARRQRDTATLAQVHLVMDRTFGSLVMSSNGAAGIPGVGGAAGATPVAQPAAASDQSAAASATVPQPQARPRLVLEAAGSEHGPRPPDAQMPMQRLEVVVEKPPIPPGWGGGPLADTNYMTEDPDIRAARGVFEIRPGKGRDGASDGTWSLWWRPLPPTMTGPNAQIYKTDPTKDERSVLVADGLTECQWMAFKQRERSGAITAATFNDLPAYMEMQIATASGLTANWMFEVQWTNGPETEAEAAAEDAANAALTQGGGPGGGPGASDSSKATAAGAGTGVTIGANGQPIVPGSGGVAATTIVQPMTPVTAIPYTPDQTKTGGRTKKAVKTTPSGAATK